MTAKKRTWRVVIRRSDGNKYVGCPLLSAEKIVIDFQTSVGGVSPSVVLEAVKETDEGETPL